MFKVVNSNDVPSTQHVKVLVYGPAGVGKTTLCSTVPGPLVLDAEAGLLPLRGAGIPVICIPDTSTLLEVLTWLQHSNEAHAYKTVCLDSISEIAEQILVAAKAQYKDVRQAYGSMVEATTSVLKQFRDLPSHNVYMSSKAEVVKDGETGVLMHGPSMPGAKLAPSIPYLLDEVFYMGVATQDNKNYRYLQTAADYQHTAKDRSGKLATYEPPHLGTIFTKITEIKK